MNNPSYQPMHESHPATPGNADAPEVGGRSSRVMGAANRIGGAVKTWFEDLGTSGEAEARAQITVAGDVMADPNLTDAEQKAALDRLHNMSQD